MSSISTPTAAQGRMIEATWTRYRDLILSLRGLYGELIAAQLTVEAQLEERLGLLIAHPDVLLARAGFHQKLDLLLGLYPGASALESEEITQMRRLNRIRNMIAHGESQPKIHSALAELLCQASPEYRSSDRSMDETVEALRRLVLGICGYLVGLTDGDAFDQLRRLHIDRSRAGGLADG
jgi:hypothetical protein